MPARSSSGVGPLREILKVSEPHPRDSGGLIGTLWVDLTLECGHVQQTYAAKGFKAGDRKSCHKCHRPSGKKMF
jgi:hypothetical protein